MILQQSRPEFYCLFVSIEAAVRGVYFGIRLHRNTFRLHIDTGSESACAVGRCTRTALHLYILYGRSKVGHIYPEECMAFGIIHRDSVGCDVDACPVCSPYAQCGVTDTCSGITGGQCRRSHTEQKRDVLPEVLLFEFFFRNVGECHRGF